MRQVHSPARQNNRGNLASARRARRSSPDPPRLRASRAHQRCRRPFRGRIGGNTYLRYILKNRARRVGLKLLDPNPALCIFQLE